MRKRFYLFTFGLLVVTALAFVSCSEDSELLYSPSLTVSTNAITASNSEGTYSFSYSVDNPANDGEISCGTDADWITDLTCSSSGTVSFYVSENTGANPRMARITLTYVSDYGSVSEIVTVAQDSMTAHTPQFSVQPTAVTTDMYGGACSFSYSVTNAEEEGIVSCVCMAGWINSFDYSTPGVVSFLVDENVDSAVREAEISVFYTYSGGEQSQIVTVVQDFTSPIDISDLVGTYECTGIVSNDDWDFDVTGVEPGVEATWTMKIFKNTNGTLILSGLVPETVDYYPEITEGYIAQASVIGTDIYVYPQFTGYINGLNYFYICWFLCTGYYSLETATDEFPAGWYYEYSSDIPCRFRYDASTQTWTSDYGLFLGLSRQYLTFDYAGFYDMFAPGMTIRKISDSTTSAVTASAGDIDVDSRYVGAMPVK